MKRVLLTLLIVASACGDSGTATTVAPAADTTAPPATEAPPPTTAAPATTATPTTEAGIVPGADPDVDAVVAAYAIAFDSTSTFEEKATYIDDPSGLESTVERYLEQGADFGGIEVVASAVEIAGDEATVFYDLLFGGAPTYPNLEGTATRTADGWKVPRGVFCGLMASARTPCDTG